MIVFSALVDERHDGLAGHVAAEDQQVRAVKFACVEKLAPANVRAMYICCKEEFGHRNILVLRKGLGSAHYTRPEERGLSLKGPGFSAAEKTRCYSISRFQYVAFSKSYTFIAILGIFGNSNARFCTTRFDRSAFCSVLLPSIMYPKTWIKSCFLLPTE